VATAAYVERLLIGRDHVEPAGIGKMLDCLRFGQSGRPR
jgi:hypothetical protein